MCGLILREDIDTAYVPSFCLSDVGAIYNIVYILYFFSKIGKPPPAKTFLPSQKEFLYIKV